MKKTLIIFLFICTIFFSIFGENKGDIQLTQRQWDVYIQAIQAISPFIHKGEKMVVFGILEAPTNGYVSNQPIPFLIYTSGKKLYTRIPENWLKDNKLPEQNIRQEDVFKYRNNIYHTKEHTNMPILTDMIAENGGYEKSIFNLEKYPDGFILREQISTNKDCGFFHYSLGNFFYAVVDENGTFHGVTFLRYGDNTPYNRKYYLNLGFDYMMNIWAYHNLSINFLLFDNYAY